MSTFSRNEGIALRQMAYKVILKRKSRTCLCGKKEGRVLLVVGHPPTEIGPFLCAPCHRENDARLLKRAIGWTGAPQTLNRHLQIFVLSSLPERLVVIRNDKREVVDVFGSPPPGWDQD